MRNSTLRLLKLFLLTCPVAVFAAADVDPLFASHDLIEAKLVTPIAKIMRDRDSEEYEPGVFEYEDESGILHQFDVGVRTRGNFRRRAAVCRFAPLRLNFKKSQTAGTLFDKQDKLKLVTHCENNSKRYQQAVVNEYLAYRVLNLLTDNSFRARLLLITYVDPDDQKIREANYAILLEHDNSVAERIDMPVLEADKIKYDQLNPEFANLISVFHYFIGNTDFSQIQVSPGKDCCHNHALFANDGEPVISIPYDFDMSGLVNAPHSQPNPRFRLRSVRQRLYRGRCTNNRFIPKSVRQFFDKREQINELIRDEYAELAGSSKNTRKFVDLFYAKLSTPRKIQKALITKCI